MLLGILTGIAGFAMFLLLHWSLFHYRALKATFKNLVLLWTAFLMAGWIHGTLWGMTFSPAIAGYLPVRFLATMLVFACCFVLYMPFYYTIATSLSVQTMILVHEAGPTGLPLAYLQDLFASKGVLHARLGIMVDNGYLVRTGDRYRVAPKGAMISKVFGGLKILWRLGAGG